MKVVVEDAAVFDCGDEATYRSLRRLIDEAVQGRHELDVGDPDAFWASDFVQRKLAPGDREDFERVVGQVQWAAPSGRVCARIQARATARREARGYDLPAHEAGSWAGRPLQVILENDVDHLLVHLAARVTPDPAGARLRLALKQGWLTWAGVGGAGEIPKRVRGAAIADRLFALFDSDRDEWYGPKAKKAENAIKACREQALPSHCLAGRELENYLPSWLFEDASRHKARGGRKIDKAPLLFRKLHDELALNEGHWKKQFGEEAVRDALDLLGRRATRPVTPATLRDNLRAWRALSPEERMVDDLKARFGPMLESLLNDLKRHLEAGQDPGLDSLQRADMAALGERLDQWL